MTNNDKDEVREFRLEGFGLVLVAIVLLAAFTAAFAFGRWFERRSRPEITSLTETTDPLAEVVDSTSVPVEESMDYFDQLEPVEQKVEDPPATASMSRKNADTTPAVSEAAPATSDKNYAWGVQVFAGRQLESANQAVQKLKAAGQASRIDQEVFEGERLYRVRALGWESREAAVDAAKQLKDKGFEGAFAVDLKGS